MKILLLTFLVLIPGIIRADSPTAATGVEAGYGKVNRNKEVASGTSWVYHFEFDVDKNLNFFGQAGQTRARKPGTNLTQTTFAGGIGLDFIEALNFRFGAAITDTHGKDALGALFGCAFKIPMGAFLTGPSVTYIRTPDDESASLRWMLFLRL